MPRLILPGYSYITSFINYLSTLDSIPVIYAVCASQHNNTRIILSTHKFNLFWLNLYFQYGVSIFYNKTIIYTQYYFFVTTLFLMKQIAKIIARTTEVFLLYHTHCYGNVIHNRDYRSLNLCLLLGSGFSVAWKNFE
jgi:hypothetical protein